MPRRGGKARARMNPRPRLLRAAPWRPVRAMASPRIPLVTGGREKRVDFLPRFFRGRKGSALFLPRKPAKERLQPPGLCGAWGRGCPLGSIGRGRVLACGNHPRQYRALFLDTGVRLLRFRACVLRIFDPFEQPPALAFQFRDAIYKRREPFMHHRFQTGAGGVLHGEARRFFPWGKRRGSGGSMRRFPLARALSVFCDGERRSGVGVWCARPGGAGGCPLGRTRPVLYHVHRHIPAPVKHRTGQFAAFDALPYRTGRNAKTRRRFPHREKRRGLCLGSIPFNALRAFVAGGGNVGRASIRHAGSIARAREGKQAGSVVAASPPCVSIAPAGCVSFCSYLALEIW